MGKIGGSGAANACIHAVMRRGMWQRHIALNPSTKQVEITISVLQVTLTSNDFDSTVQARLTADQYEMYQILQSTRGNRPDLF
ncbi:MAG: hypothetical protein IK093_20520 [Ruminiclostridium sp.]|nr:hypothetical protein [Ruminiclostridium sp.]